MECISAGVARTTGSLIDRVRPGSKSVRANLWVKNALSQLS